jgi:hypothetical protein
MTTESKLFNPGTGTTGGNIRFQAKSDGGNMVEVLTITPDGIYYMGRLLTTDE